jgi:nucleotide-binding universal stress UspA family protein
MQGPPRRILLATDLSPRCDRALDRAAALASAWNAELIALHVMPEDPVDYDAPQIPSWRRPPSAQMVAEARARTEIHAVLPSASVAIERGDPTDAILRVAAAEGCDLIVTGVARHEPLGRLSLGSTVERLVRRSHIPILVVRSRGQRPYRHVVAATDFSEAARHALEAVVRYFPSATVTLFHSYDVPMRGVAEHAPAHAQQFHDMASQWAAQFLDQADLTGWPGEPNVLIEEGEPDRLLHDYAREKEVDLVAVGSRGHGALYQVVIGSVAHRLLATLPCDVLLIREPKAAAGGAG